MLEAIEAEAHAPAPTEAADEAFTLRAMCADGTAQLWLVCHDETVAGVIVTELCELPKGRTCHFLAAAGSFLDDGPASLDRIEAWAKSKGCVRLELSGRLGWSRRLERRGWRECAVRFGKDL